MPMPDINKTLLECMLAVRTENGYYMYSIHFLTSLCSCVMYKC